MAQTLSEGPVVPNADGGEAISATGVAELRTLGATTNSALAGIRVSAEAAAQTASAADSTSRARDAALEGLIAGMEGMTYVGAWDPGTTYRINDVVTHGGDAWARLTAGSVGEPGASPTDWGLVARKGDGGGFGELSETDVDGLYDTVDNGIEARLAAIEYDSGTLDITASFPEVTNGSIQVRRVGATVHVTLYDVEFTNSTPPEFFYLAGALPPGYRPAAHTSFAALADVSGTTTRRVRFQANGQILLYAISSTSRINATVSYLTPDAMPA